MSIRAMTSRIKLSLALPRGATKFTTKPIAFLDALTNRATTY